MASENSEPTYSGMDKYPGLIATAVTVVIGVVFLGALYSSATSGHGGDHGGDHGGGEHATEHAAPAGEAGH